MGGNLARGSVDPQPWRDAFERSTGLPLHWTWRVRSPGRTTSWRPPNSSFELTTGAGIEKVWPRLDFYGDRAEPEAEAGGFRIQSTEARRAAAEHWALPGRPSTRGMTLRLSAAGSSQETLVDHDVPPSMGAEIARAGRIRVEWALAPVRSPEAPGPALHPSTRSQLRALGYVDEERDRP